MVLSLTIPCQNLKPLHIMTFPLSCVEIECFCPCFPMQCQHIWILKVELKVNPFKNLFLRLIWFHEIFGVVETQMFLMFSTSEVWVHILKWMEVIESFHRKFAWSWNFILIVWFNQQMNIYSYSNLMLVDHH
jgi:hypothetical protein